MSGYKQNANYKLLLLGLVMAVIIRTPLCLLAQPAPVSPTNFWQVVLGRHNESSPALDMNGNIYVITGEGKLFALNPDGSPRWEFATDFETASTPALGSDGTVYFGCRNRRFYAVDSTGTLHWSFKTGGWVDASPAIATNGMIYFGSWDKQFYALDAAGQERWKFATGGPITSSAAVDVGGDIYFGSHDSKFYALRPDGTKKWEFATGGAVLSSPAIGTDGALYFTSTDGYLRVVNTDGSLRWKLHTGGINAASPVLGTEGNIYLGVNSNHCEISAEGKLLWARELSPFGYRLYDWIVATPVALESNLVFTAGTDLFLSIFERGGRGLWHNSIGSGIRASPLLTVDGKAYAASSGSGFYAFKDFPRVAVSPWPMFRGNPQRTGRVSPAP